MGKSSTPGNQYTGGELPTYTRSALPPALAFLDTQAIVVEDDGARSIAYSDGRLWATIPDVSQAGAVLAQIGLRSKSVRDQIKALLESFYKRIQVKSTGSSLGAWQARTYYDSKSRILPTDAFTGANNAFTTGWKVLNGVLYALQVKTPGISGATEPNWPDPPAISTVGKAAWSAFTYNRIRSTDGVTQQASANPYYITDGTIVWQVRPVFFVDPSAVGSLETGTQLQPFLSYKNVAFVDNTSGATQLASLAASWIATDGYGDTTADQFFAAASIVQRAGTTTSGITPLGPKNAFNGDQVAYRSVIVPGENDPYQQAISTNARAWEWGLQKRTIFGVYKKPGDTETKAFYRSANSTPCITSRVTDGTNFDIDTYGFALKDLDVKCVSSNGSWQVQAVGGYISIQSAAGGMRLSMGIERCKFSGSTSHGLVIAARNVNTLHKPAWGLEIDDCEFSGNGAHGIINSAHLQSRLASLGTYDYLCESAVRYRRNRAFANGSDIADQAYHHGFSQIVNRNTYDITGWTGPTANVYSRVVNSYVASGGAAILSTVNSVYGVEIRSAVAGVQPALLKPSALNNTASATTTPAIGEFSYKTDTSTLYVNLGAALNSDTSFKVGLTMSADFVYEECEGFLQPTFPALNGIEGYGFGIDELATAKMIRCATHHNSGSGVLWHYSTGALALDCFSYDNRNYGWYQAGTRSSRNERCHAWDNGSYGFIPLYSCSDWTLKDCTSHGNAVGVLDEKASVTPYDLTTFAYVPGQNVANSTGNNFTGNRANVIAWPAAASGRAVEVSGLSFMSTAAVTAVGYVDKQISSAQLLALNATPVTIVPAPGAGLAIIPTRVAIRKPAGVAYGGVAAGEDLVLKYTNAAGAQCSSAVETTGFLDQTTDQVRMAGMPGSTGINTADYAPVANAPVVLHLLTGEVITGDQPLYVRVWYDTLNMAFVA